ncbi:substance-P receptor-like [Mytilus edulis]|uniref:substance-P receptor-like n=1 Tax=Mytilus edulis TaxID=6550 RepID=UPI0039EFAA06
MMIHCKSIPGERVIVNSSATDLLKLFDAPEIHSKPILEVTLKIIFYIIAIAGDIVGNFIVILIIICHKKIRTTTNILILNLAISDIMVAFFCMWVHLGNQISPMWPFGAFMCKFATFVQVLSVTLSVLTLTCISIERFLAIVFPLKGKMTKRGIYISISVTWISSLAIASPHLFIHELVDMQFRNRKDTICQESWPKYYTDTKCKTEEPGKKIYYTIEGVVMYFIPILVMIVAYSIIIMKLTFRKIPGNITTSSTSSHDKIRRKVIRMLLVVLLSFVICWTPQQTFLLWDVYRSRNVQIPKYVISLKYAAVYLAYFNSALNPIIYAGLNENFRKGFKEAFKCQLWGKRNQVRPVTGPVTPLTVNVSSFQNISSVITDDGLVDL